MKNKILITGAAGFLGGRTAKYFASFANIEVVATSRRSDRKEELELAGCTFLPGDLVNSHFCEIITKNINIVVHCAALSAPFGSYESFFAANYLATKNLVDACLKNGVHTFIFISTPSIYFNFSDRFDVKESDPLPDKFVNNYASTKMLAEQFVLKNNKKNMRTIALRPRAIIGAEDTVIFPRVLAAYQAKRLKVIGNGKNVCDLTCVSNVIEAIKCSIQASEHAYGEAYNITDGEGINFWEAVNYTLNSLGCNPVKKRIPKSVAMLAAAIFEQRAKWSKDNKEPILTRYGIGILSNNFTLNIDKARVKLGYEPIMKTMEGIEEFIIWYKKQN